MLMYSESFIKKCLQIYPDWNDLKYFLETHSLKVGKLLECAIGFTLDEDQIISLFRNKKEHKILEAAKRAKQKRELYQEWLEIAEKHTEKMGMKHSYERL